MSTFIIGHSTPLPGRASQLETRMRTLIGVMAQRGARSTRFVRNIMGEGAGSFSLVAEFEDFQKLMSSYEKFRKDPLFLDVSQQVSDNPAGQNRGPFVLRDIYGQTDLSSPVHAVRSYRMSRKNLPQMIEIVKEIDHLSEGYKLTAVLPVYAPEMDMIHGVYHFDSLTDAGKIIDEVGTSAEFQELVLKANEMGTLIRSGLNIKM